MNTTIIPQSQQFCGTNQIDEAVLATLSEITVPLWDAYGYPNRGAVDELASRLKDLDPTDIYYSLKFCKMHDLIDSFLGVPDPEAIDRFKKTPEIGKAEFFRLDGTSITIGDEKLEPTPEVDDAIDGYIQRKNRRNRFSGFEAQKALKPLQDAVIKAVTSVVAKEHYLTEEFETAFQKDRKILSRVAEMTADQLDFVASGYIQNLGHYASIARRNAQTEETTTEETDMPDIMRIPAAYPMWVWQGTIYGQFANVCSRENYIPQEFLIEALKTFVGGAAGHRLGVEGDDDEARFYTILIGEAGRGKSTAMKYAQNVFPASLAYVGGAHLWPDLGCFVGGFGSQVGLIRKSRNHSQILLHADELSVLADKFRIHGSGLAFLSLINQLFEKTIPPANYTKQDMMEIQNPVHFSLLGATTPDVWQSTFGGTGSEGSGFFQRLNIIASEETRTVPVLQKINFQQFSPLVEKIKSLREQPYELPLDAEARQLLNEWFQWLQEQEDKRAGRLQVLALRNAAHLGWLLNVGRTSEITPAEVIRRAVILSNYQLGMRRKYQPIQGDSPWAILENLIVRKLQEMGSMGRRDLYRKINGSRHGLKVFEMALTMLKREGLITIEHEKGRTNKKEFIVWNGEESELSAENE